MYCHIVETQNQMQWCGWVTHEGLLSVLFLMSLFLCLYILTWHTYEAKPRYSSLRRPSLRLPPMERIKRLTCKARERDNIRSQECIRRRPYAVFARNLAEAYAPHTKISVGHVCTIRLHRLNTDTFGRGEKTNNNNKKKKDNERLLEIYQRKLGIFSICYRKLVQKMCDREEKKKQPRPSGQFISQDLFW